ncbi:hypothetical protein JKP88DRAFT_199041, partial [Tribonema minus]
MRVALATCIHLLAQSIAFADISATSTSRHAYAAVLHDNSVQGLQALGASLRHSGSQAPLVALVSPGVSQSAISQLQRSGWLVRRAAEASPAAPAQQLTTALEAWLLNDYERVVLLGPDTLALANVDDLFTCPAALCFVVASSELAGAAALVLKPSASVHADMQRASGQLRPVSTTIAEFISVYTAPLLPQCTYFDPQSGYDEQAAIDTTCHRLPTRYSGDLLLVVLNGGLSMVRAQNKMPDEWWTARRARLVVFNLAGLTPAWWASAPFLPMTQIWHQSVADANAGRSWARQLSLLLCLPPLIGACVAAVWLRRGGSPWFDRRA